MLGCGEGRDIAHCAPQAPELAFTSIQCTLNAMPHPQLLRTPTDQKTIKYVQCAVHGEPISKVTQTFTRAM